MPSRIFINAPLVEAVFEIRFKDPKAINYDIFVGELYSKLKKKFPISEALKPQEVPAFLLPYIVQHRFRSVQNGYPLYQTGPGLLSFNIDGVSYKNNGGWLYYKKLISSFVGTVENVAADKFLSENIAKISLRYVNKIVDPGMYSDIKNYFSEKLGTQINLNFSTDVSCLNNLENTALSQTYVQENNQIIFNLKTITEGTRKILLDITCESSGEVNIENFSSWLNNAHSNIEKIFLGTTKNITTLFS